MSRKRHIHRRRPHLTRLDYFFKIVPSERVDFSTSVFKTGPASLKGFYVFQAIESQLNHKGFPPPHDDSWKMDKDYAYNVTTMQMMLKAVADELNDSGYKFVLTQKLIIDCTKATLAVVRATVSDKTV